MFKILLRTIKEINQRGLANKPIMEIQCNFKKYSIQRMRKRENYEQREQISHRTQVQNGRSKCKRFTITCNVNCLNIPGKDRHFQIK